MCLHSEACIRGFDNDVFFSFVAYYDGRWDIRYIRQCATLGEVGPDEGRWCKERTGNFRVKVKYCHCDNKDGCNAGTSISVQTLGLTIGLLLSFFAQVLRTT